MLEELKNNINGTGLKISNVTKSFKQHLTDIWINPKDKKEWGLIDLKLDIIGDETLNADCDVTDHYVESNTAYQDQITLKPKTYTVSGEVGELVWYQNNPISQVFGQVAQRLEGVVSFLPIRSKSFNQMKKNVMKVSQWVDTASNALTKLSSLTTGSLGKYTDADGTEKDILGTLTRQAQAYQWLLYYRDNRMPLSVRTPWGILNSYVITNLELKQPKESRDKSIITITFKEFRLTSIKTVPFNAEKYQGNAAFENEPKADQGKTAGEDVSLPTETVKDKNGKEVNACFMYDDKGGEIMATLDANGEPNFERKTLVGGDTLYLPINVETPEYEDAVVDWGTKCEKQVQMSTFEIKK